MKAVAEDAGVTGRAVYEEFQATGGFTSCTS